MPIWTKDTMPEALQRKHNTKVGTWGRLLFWKAALRFIELTEEGRNREPPLWSRSREPHGRAPGLASCRSGDGRLEWYSENFTVSPQKTYFPQKYNTNPVHSRSARSRNVPAWKEALDLGCGQDATPSFGPTWLWRDGGRSKWTWLFENLRNIVAEEDAEMMMGLYDINAAALPKTMTSSYRLWSLMFLEADRFQRLSAIWEHTNPGATISLSVPWDLRKIILSYALSFTFKDGENWRSIPRIGNWSSTMKIKAISIVETRMAIGFNSICNHVGKENKEKAGC